MNTALIEDISQSQFTLVAIEEHDVMCVYCDKVHIGFIRAVTDEYIAPLGIDGNYLPQTQDSYTVYEDPADAMIRLSAINRLEKLLAKT